MIGVLSSAGGRTAALADGGGGAPPVSATRWRIYITAGNGNDNTSIQTIFFLNADGKAISTSGATVSASSNITNYPAAAAVNNVWGTGGAVSAANVRWAANGGTNPPGAGQYLEVQFTSAKEVCAVWMMPHASTDAPADYSWQYYDGSTWQTVYSTTGDTWTTATWKKIELQTRSSPTLVSNSAWQLDIDANGGEASGIVSLYEIVFHNSDMSAISYSGGSAFSSSEFSGSFLDDYAFDGNTGTRWASAASASDPFPKEIGFNFSGAVSPEFVSMLCEVPGSFCASVDFQYGSWTSLKAYTSRVGVANMWMTLPLFTE